ncbi:hypothetical protein [Microbacterium foliorum]|uniref:hypothetical protein n=1 Tax=Microbacterium foliorum TaxID=104336 RepID=UPI00099FBF5F|nr:hypothetical protein [Microbacterium foliorum]AQY00090.1 hypothetical protein B2G67_00195 [Microbacterium foliorum]
MTSDGENSGRDVSGAEPSEDGIAALIEDWDGDDPDQVGEIPAGNAGADSGGSGPVRVDPSSESSVQDESVHNDEPGVGTRRSGD